MIEKETNQKGQGTIQSLIYILTGSRGQQKHETIRLSIEAVNSLAAAKRDRVRQYMRKKSAKSMRMPSSRARTFCRSLPPTRPSSRSHEYLLLSTKVIW